MLLIIMKYMKRINYFESFTGVGGFSLGMPANFNCVGFSEIDKYCSAVLNYRYPNVKNYGDIATIKWSDVPDFELLVGGSPCQDLSIAGKRSGIYGQKSQLFFKFIECLKQKQPEYFIFENVGGTLTSNRGKDFITVVGSMAEAGYNVIWQVLNSQDFNKPLQRSRIFVVGYLGREPGPEIFHLGKIKRSPTETRIGTLARFCATDYKGPNKQRSHIIVKQNENIRVLTPIERERLMSWPDDWTKYGIIEKKKVNISNTQRFKMTGNGVDAKVVNYIINKYIK